MSNLPLPPARRCPRLQKLYLRYGPGKTFSDDEAAALLGISVAEAYAFLRHNPEDDFVRSTVNHDKFWLSHVDPRNAAGRRFKVQYLEVLRGMDCALTPASVGHALGIPAESAAFVISLMLRNKTLRQFGPDRIEPVRRRVINNAGLTYEGY